MTGERGFGFGFAILRLSPAPPPTNSTTAAPSLSRTEQAPESALLGEPALDGIARENGEGPGVRLRKGAK
jgi:hypothetical protein